MNKDRNQDVSRDLGTSSDRAMFSPSEARDEAVSPERGQDNEQAPRQGALKGGPVSRDEPAERSEHGSAQDAGRTQGGGSGGHSPSQDVEEQVEIRNNPKELNK